MDDDQELFDDFVQEQVYQAKVNNFAEAFKPPKPKKSRSPEKQDPGSTEDGTQISDRDGDVSINK